MCLYLFHNMIIHYYCFFFVYFTSLNNRIFYLNLYCKKENLFDKANLGVHGWGWRFKIGNMRPHVEKRLCEPHRIEALNCLFGRDPRGRGRCVSTYTKSPYTYYYILCVGRVVLNHHNISQLNRFAFVDGGFALMMELV